MFESESMVNHEGTKEQKKRSNNSFRVLAGFVSWLLRCSFVLFFSSKINFDDALVVLDFIHGAFAQNGALMQHRDFARDLTDEGHVVLDDDDAVFALEAHQQLAGLVC